MRAQHAWLVIEPGRGPGQRALTPIPSPAKAPLYAAFPTHSERQVDGFRVVDLRAPAPVTLAPGTIPGATLFGPPA